ncbi:hypothetical protein GO685_03230 [Wolbachia endosymbiont of Madathamugadia hiepei]|uniref:hypothetical protein n=1 Tax=Wolbachia endosymbiont of Madathamugadia hiepei TaxID=1241303 RepID=UPI001589CB45|nr:hypothetical protein [Wolbachia endosymbiont of Madathamugadia hiepei]NUX01498.1 hypothetical protein [Wolbachia endosymbiont of Madathamugadia hiepei]
MTDSFSNDENALFKAQIREQDLVSQVELQEIQGAADEFARQAIVDKLNQAEVEHEKLQLELEQEASDRVEDIISYAELSAAENEDNLTSGIEGLLAKLFKFFNFMDSELGVETDPQVYSVIKKREEEEKEAWIATVVKFLRNKFNKLIKAIFSRDLSFQQKLDQEIERLFERLSGSGLSQEEEAAILESLEALRDLKLKLQMFVVGSVITMFAELLSVELTASVEKTKEEGKEKTSAKEKEATKEVHEIIEIKVDSKQKPTVPVSLFDFSSGVAKPITLTKPEFDLLSASLKNFMRPVHNYDMNKGNSGVPKQEVKEKQEQENKKATQPAPRPVAAHPQAVPGKKIGVSREAFDSGNMEGSTSRSRNVSGSVDSVNGRGTASNNKPSTASSFNEESKSTDRHKTDGFSTKLKEKVITKRECAEASTKHNYPIDHFQVPAGTNGKSHVSAKNEPQPKSECSSVKIDNHVESIGKAQEEVSSRSM